jgi:hypothetical protein
LAGCGNSVLKFFCHQVKSDTGSKSRGRKNLAGMWQQFLVLCFFYHQIKKRHRGEDQEAEKPCRNAATVSCTFFLYHQMKKRHGFEEQGAPPLLEECDVVLEGRPFDSNISAETFYYKVRYCFRYPDPTKCFQYSDPAAFTRY